MTMGHWAMGLAALLACFAGPSRAAALGTSFTYQGELKDQGVAPNAAYDFEFALFDVASNGSALDTLTLGDVDVKDGLFTVELDYTAVPFEAALQYYLEVRVRRGSETGGYTQLLPRQRITAVPYALNAQSVQKQCPAGYLRTNSLCVQQVDVSGKTFSGCASYCVGLNAHICTSPEVRAALTVALPVSGGWLFDWIGDQTADDEALYVNSGSDAANPDGARPTTTSSYCRCCVSIE